MNAQDWQVRADHLQSLAIQANPRPNFDTWAVFWAVCDSAATAAERDGATYAAEQIRAFSTPVIVCFRKYPANIHGGREEVQAIFPGIAGSAVDMYACQCYMHVGQHGVVGGNFIHGTKLATQEDYAPLLRELESLGYRVKVVSRIQPRMYHYNNR